MSEIVGRLRVTPVQARAIRTVEHILGTAAVLLDELGVDRFNTNLLAARAGVRVRTIYRYFDDKHAIILCLAERMYQRADESLAASLCALADHEVDWRKAIDHVIDDYFATMGAIPGWAAIRRALQAVPGLDELRARTVRRHADWLAKALRDRGIDRTRGQTQVIARVAFTSGSAVLEPVLKASPAQRKLLIAELKLMLRSYLAAYLD